MNWDARDHGGIGSSFFAVLRAFSIGSQCNSTPSRTSWILFLGVFHQTHRSGDVNWSFLQHDCGPPLYSLGLETTLFYSWQLCHWHRQWPTVPLNHVLCQHDIAEAFYIGWKEIRKGFQDWMVFHPSRMPKGLQTLQFKLWLYVINYLWHFVLSLAMLEESIDFSQSVKVFSMFRSRKDVAQDWATDRFRIGLT